MELAHPTVRDSLRPFDFEWNVSIHRYTLQPFQQAVKTLMMIRNYEHRSTFSLLPNELLFIIFDHLLYAEREAQREGKRTSRLASACCCS